MKELIINNWVIVGIYIITILNAIDLLTLKRELKKQKLKEAKE